MAEDKKMEIVLVDDDPMFRKALETYLKNQVPGVRIRTFDNGEACLHHLQERPDVVILDYLLDSEFPDSWNGMQVLKKINELDPGIAVIILSSQENIETAVSLISEGALEYIVKNEKAFPRIRDLVLSVKDEFTVEEDTLPETQEEKKQTRRRMLIIAIGIILLILLILFQ